MYSAVTSIYLFIYIESLCFILTLYYHRITFFNLNTYYFWKCNIAILIIEYCVIEQQLTFTTNYGTLGNLYASVESQCPTGPKVKVRFQSTFRKLFLTQYYYSFNGF